MSILCGLSLLECVYCLGCTHWVFTRCGHSAHLDSKGWRDSTPDEFEPVPRMCRYILAVYEDDLQHPIWKPPGDYGINLNGRLIHKTYDDTGGKAPPYILFLDHEHRDIVLAIRGLNLAKGSEYRVLLDNKLWKMDSGGYVHHGLYEAAKWVLKAEGEVLRRWVEEFPEYTLTFAGHSLGSGVAAMLTLMIMLDPDKLGNFAKDRVRCYAIAPARCMSLDLAVQYAHVINSVILQDDFLPRTAAPLRDIFTSVFCLPCLLWVRCMRDTCQSEQKRLMDTRRLYAPGRFYHILDSQPWRMGRDPPDVKTGIPGAGKFDEHGRFEYGRFEHIILSCHTTSDHAIIWIERESQRALNVLMLKEDKSMEIPANQRMERRVQEHDAAKRALPNVFSGPQYGTFEQGECR